ncbi:hypothetical protein K492DRAFT_203237 [Lichtheimia hyalospora FSU 10163]|nr:hypothetical protein K492DRAFT_203237 [Lichtheimia hyalospora FSU 10163]
MIPHNDTPSDQSSSQADSARLLLGSPLSQAGDMEDSPCHEYNSGKVIYANPNINHDDDMRPKRQDAHPTSNGYDRTRHSEQDTHDLSISHYSNHTVGDSDRVFRSMRQSNMARSTNMKRSVSTSNNEQHNNNEEQQYHWDNIRPRRTVSEIIPSRRSHRLAFRRQYTTDDINQSDHSTPTFRSTNHHNQERQQQEGLQALTRIETQFAELRNRIYQERMAELNQEALTVAQGTHPELVSLFQVLDQTKAERTKKAESWHKQRQIIIRNQYDAIEHQADLEFVTKRKGLKEKLLESLHRQLFQLKYERESLLQEMPTPTFLSPSVTLQQQHKPRYQRIAPMPEGLSQAAAYNDLIMIKKNISQFKEQWHTTQSDHF